MLLEKVFRLLEPYVISQLTNQGGNVYSVFMKQHDEELFLDIICDTYLFILFSYSWLVNLESTKWFQYLGALIRTARLVCDSIKSARSVLIHCSDGWDRTSQIASLAEIMLDPYYRTIEVCKLLRH